MSSWDTRERARRRGWLPRKHGSKLCSLLDSLDWNAKTFLAFLKSLLPLINHCISFVPSKLVDRYRVAATEVLRAAVLANGSTVFNLHVLTAHVPSKLSRFLAVIAFVALLSTEFA